MNGSEGSEAQNLVVIMLYRSNIGAGRFFCINTSVSKDTVSRFCGY